VVNQRAGIMSQTTQLQSPWFPASAWWHQSCMSFGCSGGGGLDVSGETGWPTYAVDSDATRNRAVEWMSFTYDMKGEEGAT
jgi:hypothetical protein